APVVESFRSARPGDLPPGWHVGFDNPEAEERARQGQQAARDQWAAATGYQVTIRLEANLLKTWGAFRLSAEAKPLRSGGPVLMPTFHVGDGRSLNAEAVDLETAMFGDAPKRQQAWEQDPVFGRKEPFTADPKRHPRRPGQASLPPHFFDYLPEVAR